jgi:hypothetical protein
MAGRPEPWLDGAVHGLQKCAKNNFYAFKYIVCVWTSENFGVNWQ